LVELEKVVCLKVPILCDLQGRKAFKKQDWYRYEVADGNLQKSVPISLDFTILTTNYGELQYINGHICLSGGF